MAAEVHAHVKTTDKGVMLREHASIEAATTDAAESNAKAEKMGLKVRYEAATGPFPR